MATKTELPTVFFESQADFEAWLEEHHATSDGIWLKLAKKGSGVASVSRSDALDAAICYGWIDSQAKPVDDRFWLQRFTPRRPRSTWSKVNCTKAVALEAQGRMNPAGRREVEAAKQDGRWDRAYPSQKNMTVPKDLQRKLDEHPRAQAFFKTLDSRNRYAILYRIHDAKRDDTRARRIEKYVAMLDEQKTIY